MYLTHRIRSFLVVSLLGVPAVLAGFLFYVTEATAAAEKVDVCHVTNVPEPGDGLIISIADPAWPAHAEHGDKLIDGDDDDAVVTYEDGTCYVPEIPPVPDAVDDEVTTPVDTPVTIPVLANDYYEGTVTPSLHVGPSHGVVGPWVDGRITYYPDPGFFGTDSFEYQICNTADECDIATVTITVGP